MLNGIKKYIYIIWSLYSNICYNNIIIYVHSLQHIADDYDTFGPLDNCSAFPFVNHMKVFKKTVCKHHQPLQQAVNQNNDINNFKFLINESSQINDSFMKCLKQYNNGPLTGDCLGPQFKKLVFG